MWDWRKQSLANLLCSIAPSGHWLFSYDRMYLKVLFPNLLHYGLERNLLQVSFFHLRSADPLCVKSERNHVPSFPSMFPSDPSSVCDTSLPLGAEPVCRLLPPPLRRYNWLDFRRPVSCRCWKRVWAAKADPWAAPSTRAAQIQTEMTEWVVGQCPRSCASNTPEHKLLSEAQLRELCLDYPAVFRAPRKCWTRYSKLTRGLEKLITILASIDITPVD